MHIVINYFDEISPKAIQLTYMLIYMYSNMHASQQ